MKKHLKKVLCLVCCLLFLCSCFAEASAEETKQIVVVNMYFPERTGLAISMFQEKYPDYKIVFKEQLDTRVLNTWIMAGTGGADIFATQDLFLPMSSYEYYAAGTVEDLSKYPEIMQYADDYRMEQFNAMTVDGHLIAIPETQRPRAFLVNDELAEKLGIVFPEGNWTWMDLAQIGRQVKAYNEANGTKYYVMKDNLYAPYILEVLNANAVDVVNGEAQFVQEKYQEALKAWKELIQEDLIYDSRNAQAGKETVSVALLSHAYCSYGYMAENHYLCPPQFDDETRWPVSASGLMLNANSEYKEQAAYFLSCYFSPKVREQFYVESTGLIFKDESRHHTAPDIWKPIGEENKQLWLKLNERGVMPIGVYEIEREQWNVFYPQLISGEIDELQFLQECQIRANMMLGE